MEDSNANKLDKILVVDPKLRVAWSSYNLQTEFQGGGHLVFPNGTNFESNVT